MSNISDPNADTVDGKDASELGSVAVETATFSVQADANGVTKTLALPGTGLAATATADTSFITVESAGIDDGALGSMDAVATVSNSSSNSSYSVEVFAVYIP